MRFNNQSQNEQEQYTDSNNQDQIITYNSQRKMRKNSQVRNGPLLRLSSYRYYPIFGVSSQLKEHLYKLYRILGQINYLLTQIRKQPQPSYLQYKERIQNVHEDYSIVLGQQIQKASYQFVRSNFLLIIYCLRYGKRVNQLSIPANQRLRLLQGAYRYQIKPSMKLIKTIFMDSTRAKQNFRYINKYSQQIENHFKMYKNISQITNFLLEKQISLLFTDISQKSTDQLSKYGQFGKTYIAIPKQYDSQHYQFDSQAKMINKLQKLQKQDIGIGKKNEYTKNYKEMKEQVKAFLHQLNELTIKFDYDFKKRRQLILSKSIQNKLYIKKGQRKKKQISIQTQIQNNISNENLLKAQQTLIIVLKDNIQSYIKVQQILCKRLYINSNNYIFGKQILNELIQHLITNIKLQQYILPVYRYIYQKDSEQDDISKYSIGQEHLKKILLTNQQKVNQNKVLSSKIYDLTPFQKSDVQIKLFHLEEQYIKQQQDQVVSDSSNEDQYNFMDLIKLGQIDFQLGQKNSKTEAKLFGAKEKQQE